MPEPHTQYRATFAVVLAGVAAYSLLQSLVLPVLPTIQHSLHTSQDAVTWVLTGYLLSASVFTPILGRIGDMIGKEKTFVVALAALGVGSLVAALAPSIGVMIAARAIQGIGGGVFPLSFGIVRDVFPAQRVSAAIGVVAALAAAGGGLGIVLAGPLVDILDVHWLFWLPMIVVCLAAVAAQLVIPPSPVRAGGRINWLAGLLLSAWLVGLLVAVSEGPTWGWASTGVIGLALASAALAAAWVLVELRSEHPLIDMRMMRVPAVWTTNVVAFLFGVGLYCAFAFLPEYLQTPRSAGYGFGASVTRSGLFLLPMCVLMFVAGMASGRATRRAGSKNVLLLAGIVSFAAFLLLTL
ncbi:MAG TPA: MFS transporter, partial [Acidimicrobiales bacterium]|nr:MFS transporter [Acidimicrobiales bacterium]